MTSTMRGRKKVNRQLMHTVSCFPERDNGLRHACGKMGDFFALWHNVLMESIRLGACNNLRTKKYVANDQLDASQWGRGKEKERRRQEERAINYNRDLIEPAWIWGGCCHTQPKRDAIRFCFSSFINMPTTRPNSGSIFLSHPSLILLPLPRCTTHTFKGLLPPLFLFWYPDIIS